MERYSAKIGSINISVLLLPSQPKVFQPASSSATSHPRWSVWRTVEGKRPQLCQMNAPSCTWMFTGRAAGQGLNHSQSHICSVSSLNALTRRERHFFPPFVHVRVLVKTHPLWLLISQRKCRHFLLYPLTGVHEENQKFERYFQ